MIKGRISHRWSLKPREAIALQNTLRCKIEREGAPRKVRHVGGIDISVKGERSRAAVVILSYPELEPVEVRTAVMRVRFPYIPGLLSFRECPVIVKALAKIDAPIDLLMVDGHGIAHPRRFGIASHIGLLTGVPTIGCAKSLLCGTYKEPGIKKGSRTYLREGKETIGAVLRSRERVKPIFISIGDRIGLAQAVGWVERCCKGYRLPEPTRLAHLTAKL